MKLCKVFERELNILIFQTWKAKASKVFDKKYLTIQADKARKNEDLTMSKIVSWLLKKGKLELGAMAHSIKRVIENCDNPIMENFKQSTSCPAEN